MYKPPKPKQPFKPIKKRKPKPRLTRNVETGQLEPEGEFERTKRTDHEFLLQKAVVRFFKFAYPNTLFNSDLGGVRFTMGQAIKLREIRPWRGHPDLVVYSRKCGYTSLFLELKQESVKLKYNEATKGARGSIDPHQAEQAAFMQGLEDEGFACSFAVGFDNACALIKAYMSDDVEAFNKLKTRFNENKKQQDDTEKYILVGRVPDGEGHIKQNTSILKIY